MMGVGVLLSVVQIEQYAFGKLRAGKYCTRCVSFLSLIELTDCLTNSLKLPGHKGTITAVDFHPKEPISTSQRYRSIE